MTRQTSAPLTRLNLQAYNRQISEFRLRSDDGREEYDLSPQYQRGSVWTEDQRIELVRSFLTGTPIPAIIVNNRFSEQWARANGPIDASHPGYGVIDGKQRIETIRAWFSGEFAVPASWFEEEMVETTEDTDDGPYVRFSNLSLVGRRKSKMWTIPTAEAMVNTVAEEAKVYLRVNGAGTDQSDDDMANAAVVAQGSS